MFDADMIDKVVKIVIADILLAGDNAVVIAMAVHRLAKRERRTGILIGTAAAVILRVAFTILVSFILKVPLLTAIGALLLLWIAVKLLADSGAHASGREATTLWGAVGIIALADITMSLDNMIAVGGIAGGHIGLLVFGLALSIPLVVFTSGILSKLMHRFPIIVWAGAGLLGWVAGEMLVKDAWIVKRMTLPVWAGYASAAVGVVLVLLCGWWMARRQRSADQDPVSQGFETGPG